MNHGLDNLEVKSMHHRVADDFKPLEYSVKKLETLDYRDVFREQYALTASLRINFTANSAQYEKARLSAMRLLAQHFYGDIHSLLAKLEHTVWGGSREDCISICAEIRSSMEILK